MRWKNFFKDFFFVSSYVQDMTAKVGVFMKIAKSLFFPIFFYSILSFSFQFFKHQKKIPINFWHLKVLNLQKIFLQNENRGKDVRIAILDTFFEQDDKGGNFESCYFDNVSSDLHPCKNLSKAERFNSFSKIIGIAEKNSLNREVVDPFYDESLKKNHGAIAASVIRQIASKVEIISIPIFSNHNLTTSVQKLIDGIKCAIEKKIDVLYLGLKIKDECLSVNQKKEIIDLLKHIPYVVAASGNDGKNSLDVAFPANSIFFSVGAFEQKNQNYFISNFSQNCANFVMPGKDLDCFVWDKLQKNSICLSVSGTSIAAACMVGCLAIIESENVLNFSPKQMQYLIQKNCIFLNKDQWKGKVVFGVIDVTASAFCLRQLNNLCNQMSSKKRNKKFHKLVNKIVQKLNFNN